MAESNFVDSLPPGWTMKERIRDNGKRDKYYYAPNGPVFNSRVEVSRYLAAERINHHNAKTKKKRALNEPWKIIAVEKVSAEYLPPGWIGEILVKQRDHTIRRDSYYTDPASKTVLRSLKAVHRYHESKELDTPSQNSKGFSDEGLEDDSTFSTATIEKQQLLVSRTRRQINFDQISDMNETVQDCQRVDEVLAAKGTLKDGLTRHENRKSSPGLQKSNQKKTPDSLRRSKRLAGIELEPTPELKQRTRTCRVAAKLTGNGVASTDECSNYNQLKIEPETKCSIEPSKSTESSQQKDRIKNFFDTSVTSEGQIVKVETVIGCDEKQRCPVLPLNSRISLNEHKSDEKIRVPLDSPLRELLTDPCIAFAITTLTGVTFDGSEISEVLPGNTSSSSSSVNLATDIYRRVKAEDHTIDREQVRHTAVSLKEHARNVESDTNSTELAIGGLWKDPCIEFAIKTLTDGIPLTCSPNIQQRSHQQQSLPKTQASDEMSLTSVSALDNFGQTDLLPQQFRDASLRSPCGTVLNQHGKER